MTEERTDKLDQILGKLEEHDKKFDGIGGELKGIKKMQQEDGVKLEQLGADIKAVADGHGVIRREMREMKEELKTDIKLVDDELKFVSVKVNKIDRTLDEHVKLPAHAV